MTKLIAMVAFALSPWPAHALAQVAAQPAADQRPDILVAPADRQLAIANLRAAIVASHFSVAEGRRIGAALDSRTRDPRYGTVTSGRTLAAMLTADLRAISGDPHFLVDYFAIARPFPAPAGGGRGDDPALANWGVVAAERLPGNIGYLRIDNFAAPEGAGRVLDGAMTMLNATDALIIDLRRNGGGNGQTVTLLSGYFLREQTHLADILARDGTTQIWTQILAPAARYLDKPVYILVSPRTFSAAEGFAYGLRALGRVTIVGQPTRGGANPVTRVQLSSRFWALVPVARVSSPITGANWQGLGVTPDIAAEESAALETAQRHAAARLLPAHRDDPLTRELELLAAPSSQGERLPRAAGLLSSTRR